MQQKTLSVPSVIPESLERYRPIIEQISQQHEGITYMQETELTLVIECKDGSVWRLQKKITAEQQEEREKHIRQALMATWGCVRDDVADICPM